MIRIVNINYRGKVTCPLSALDFPTPMQPPHMLVYKCKDQHGAKLIVFRTGKCRLMGCKEPVTKPPKCQVPYILTNLMSLTLTMNVGHHVNLYKLSTKLGCKRCMYEPEIFPAARLLQFNPACVNVFQSGKVTILGYKSMSWGTLSTEITNILRDFYYEI